MVEGGVTRYLDSIWVILQARIPKGFDAIADINEKREARENGATC